MKQEMNQPVTSFRVTCFIKKSNLLKNGEAPILMRVTINREKVSISLQGSVLPSLWNQAKERSNGTDRNARELNHYIESARSRIYAIHRELEIDGKPITATILKDRYMGKADEEELGKMLNEVHNEHNERCRKLLGVEYSQSTIYKFDTSLKYLKEFMSIRMKRDDIPLKEINEDFIRNYELYLKTEKGCANNSAIKHLKIFKKIIRIALLNDWLQKDPFASVKFRQDEVHTEFLTMIELETLLNKEFATKRLTQIRDVFAFCCFTGLAFVDVKNLKPEHIVKNSEDEMWIRKSREKTNNMCNIPLLNIPKMLLEKYKDDKECQLRGQLLPVPTNQKMNAYLKEVADICGIEKRLSTHVSRHTFATTITLANKVTMENVAKMLGHSSTRMTQHYAKVLDQSILEDMMNLDSKFGNLKIG